MQKSKCKTQNLGSPPTGEGLLAPSFGGLVQWAEKSIEPCLQSIVRATGQEFFDQAAANLCVWLGAECVMIGRLVGGDRVKILSGTLDGREMDDGEYALAGTPCERVMHDGYLICPERAGAVFPKAELLVRMKAEGYVGTALLGKDGSPIGILCAVSTDKLNPAPRTMEIMQIVGAKAAAEIEHIDTLERMLKNQEELAHISCLSGVEETISHLAHQLSQPLCAMINYTGAAQHLLKSDTINTNKLAGHLAASMQQAERAGGIIKDARDLTERYEPHRTKVDVNSLVNELSGLVSADAHRHNASVSFPLAPRLPAVSADPLQVKQVLLSLVRNAVDAMIDLHPGKRHLCVRTSGTEDSVELAVGNAGKGLSDETCAKMFEPSFAARPTGLGTSLSVSRSIVEACGGRLWADMNPNRSVTFRVTLPVAETA